MENEEYVENCYYYLEARVLAASVNQSQTGFTKMQKSMVKQNMSWSISGDYNLPLLDEPLPATAGQYSKPHTKAWAQKIASFDGYVFVTPEYNHAISGALKNAIDFIYGEWNNKAAGLVGYGGVGGSRAVENLRLILSELQIAHVRAQVGLSLITDFENYSVFKPAPYQENALNTMLNQLMSWSTAMKTLRTN